MTTTHPHPRLTEAPDYLLKFGNGTRLIAWCKAQDITAPTLAHIEAERRRRGTTSQEGNNR